MRRSARSPCRSINGERRVASYYSLPMAFTHRRGSEPAPYSIQGQTVKRVFVHAERASQSPSRSMDSHSPVYCSPIHPSTSSERMMRSQTRTLQSGSEKLRRCTRLRQDNKKRRRTRVRLLNCSFSFALPISAEAYSASSLRIWLARSSACASAVAISVLPKAASSSIGRISAFCFKKRR